ncbi:triacylglycerol lipase [Hoyosella subflava]|uniref:Triacylglycerol lipase n=1 Tax=Hoyosella subflava (strain DSM 45089 / JCM 17490 / NBRC 109087 / DQS3-9A1) TaxID=443218 RepID=F6EP76_HOYSD|nr:triacylglycerol lipase [Hoyosella subflava]AEF41736.1 Triacylglycerol lipase [Hoyosella subflava DQS3-9A1]
MKFADTMRCLTVVTVMALALGGVPAAAPPTGSSDAAVDAFYLPPDPLPGSAAGDVIRTQPFPLPLSLRLNDVTIPATAQRIMYRSNDAHDEPIAVTGTYFEPSQPWTGPGDRPLVTMAAGTQGQGDDCAPSKLFGKLLNYNFPFDVMTEYAGLGTPAVHDWMNRESQGHAVLAAARAARKLPGTSLGAASPLAIAGYSQGGGAAASAAEMQPGFAPELDLRGSFVGATASPTTAENERSPPRACRICCCATCSGARARARPWN